MAMTKTLAPRPDVALNSLAALHFDVAAGRKARAVKWQRHVNDPCVHDRLEEENAVGTIEP